MTSHVPTALSSHVSTIKVTMNYSVRTMDERDYDLVFYYFCIFPFAQVSPFKELSRFPFATEMVRSTLFFWRTNFLVLMVEKVSLSHSWENFFERACTTLLPCRWMPSFAEIWLRKYPTMKCSKHLVSLLLFSASISSPSMPLLEHTSNVDNYPFKSLDAARSMLIPSSSKGSCPINLRDYRGMLTHYPSGRAMLSSIM